MKTLRTSGLLLCVGILGSVGVACADAGESEDSGESETGLSTSQTGPSTSQTEGDGDGDGDGDDEPVDPDAGVFAAGISVDRVEINQGVGVEVAAGGQMLTPGTWSAPLIGGRPGLLRVFWATEPSFSPRAVLARVTLSHTDGSVDQFEQTREIAGPPDPGFVDGSFAFTFDETALRAGDTLVVGLFEADPAELGTDGGGPRLPAEGEAPLEVLGDTMEIKVMVVPASDPAIDGASHQLSADLREMMETDLYNLYPVNKISVEYHAPVQIVDCYDGAAILSQLSVYRNGENLGPNVYYHAIFPNSHEGSCFAGGMAWLVDDAMGEDRVSYSVNHWGESPNNFTHELGHSSGRLHSFEDGDYQPGSTGSPDCGRRSTWGYPIRAGQHPKANDWDFPAMQTLEGWLIAPTEGLALADYCYGHDDYDTWGPALNDVMGYAFPYWVSAYTYRNLATRIQTLSSWDAAALAPEGESLHGVFLADGEVRWYRMPGAVHAEAHPGRRAQLRSEGQHWQTPVAAKRTGEGEVRGLVVPLPGSVPEAFELDLEFDGRSFALELSASGVQAR